MAVSLNNVPKEQKGGKPLRGEKLCVYIYIHIYIYAQTYIYTHTHTRVCLSLRVMKNEYV
jgi:hypothetical protein